MCVVTCERQGAAPMLRRLPRAGGPRCPYKGWTDVSQAHSPSSLSSVLLCMSFLSMAPFDVTRVSAAVWRWFCRCPEIIGPVYDTSSDEEFFTPPTSPQPCSIDIRVPASTVSPTHGSLNLLSPSQTHRLRRRHAEAVRQLTSPPPVVTPVPHGPLKAYQRPVKVYRPSWAP